MVRKSEFPEDILMDGAAPSHEPAEDLLRSYLRMLGLKRLYRQGWLKRGIPPQSCESVADHSFGTALLALMTAGRPPFEDADPGKSCRMAIAHELGEVYAGDITPVDGISKEEKYRLERDSLCRVTAGAPGSEDLIALWEEFEEGVSAESRLVRRLDRLEMGIQAAVYRADGFPRMEEFIESARRVVGGELLGEVLDRSDRP